MMKLCFNATTLRDFDVMRAVRLIREYGYEGVELSLNDTHLHPLKSTRQKILDVKALCGDIDLQIACVAAGGPTLLGDTPYEPSLICADAAQRARRLDVIRRSVELAQTLECPVVNINSGLPTPQVSAVQAREYLMEALNALLPCLGDTILAIEPEPDFFVGTTDKALQIIEELNSPNVLMNLDIGHVFCSEEYCYDAIARALPYSRHIHIEDIRGGVHHHEIPGEGDIDFERITSLLKKADYRYFVSVELHHHNDRWEDALRQSRDYLLKLWQNAMSV